MTKADKATPTVTPVSTSTTAPGQAAGVTARYGPDGGQSVPVSHLVTAHSEGTVEVIHHPSERFYELLDNDVSVALLVYERNPRQTGITHAMVREDRRGRGLGTTLIASALDDLTATGGKIANYCDSVARFLAKYPEYSRRISK